MSTTIDRILHYQRAIDKNLNDEKRLMHCIQKLSTFNISISHLQDTGIGRTVNSLRKFDHGVGEAARNLVAKWKDMVARTKSSDEEDEACVPDVPESYESPSPDDDEDGGSGEVVNCPVKSKGIKRKQTGKDNYSSKRLHARSQRISESSEDSQDQEHCSNSLDYNSAEQESCSREKSRGKKQGKKSKHKKSKSELMDIQKGPKWKSSELESSKDSSNHQLDIKRKNKIEYDDDQQPDGSQTSGSCESDSNFVVDDDAEKEQFEESENISERKERGVQQHCEDSDVETKVPVREKSHSKNFDRKESSSSKHNDRTSSSKSEDKDFNHSLSNHSLNNSKTKQHHPSGNKNVNNDCNSLKSEEQKKEKHRHKHDKRKSSSSHSTSSASSNNKDKDKYKEEKKSKHSDKDKEIKMKRKNDDGIDCQSGTSFADALGMCITPPSFKKKKESSSKKEHSSKKEISSSVSKSVSSKSSHSNSSKKSSSSSKSKVDGSAGPKALIPPPPKAELEPLDVDLASTLPEISPNYKPLPQIHVNHAQRKLDEEYMLSQVIYTKNQRTKVYSGNKTGYSSVPTLTDLCTRILIENIEGLEYTGGVPFYILKPVLERLTAIQLFRLEDFNPYLIEDTDPLWQFHCNKSFKSKQRKEMESWREMYLRCVDEREIKLQQITANIKTSITKSTPVRQTKLAYVDNNPVKPPRNILKKQAKYGTANPTEKSTELKMKLISGTASSTSNPIAGSSSTDSGCKRITVPTPPAIRIKQNATAAKKTKAPIMAKLLQAIRGRYKR